MEIHNMERKLPKGPKNLKSSVLKTKKGRTNNPKYYKSNCDINH